MSDKDTSIININNDNKKSKKINNEPIKKIMNEAVNELSSDDYDEEPDKLRLEKAFVISSANLTLNNSEEIIKKPSEIIKEESDKIKQNTVNLTINNDPNEPSNVRKRLQKEILTDYIYPDNVENLKTLLTDRKNYSKLLQAVRIIKIIIAAIVLPSLLLSDTKFPNNNLGYAATILSFFVSFLEITDRIIVQSNKKRREKINLILKSLGIEYQVPELTYDDPTHDKIDGLVKKNNT
jgi:hypothetical protein